MAFAAWLVGHVLLALNLRSEREPIVRLGLFSNRLMIAWAAATLALLLVATNVAGARNLFKVTRLDASEWALVVGAAVIGTFWIEIKKLARPATRSQGEINGRGSNRS
jgi:Ca2+-transporting ATPase